MHTAEAVAVDLLQTHRLEHAFIEFTTGCNIRCVYCQSNKADYVRQDLDLSGFGQLADLLGRMRVKHVSVFGHGETTSRKDWHLYCDMLLDRVERITVTTNLAKRFPPGEIRTLSRFYEIMVSVDTADPELFRRLRRGADLGRIIATMAEIKACALAEGRTPPRFGWNCVVSDKTVFGLESFVRLGLKAGLSCFGFVHFCNYDIPKDEDFPRPIQALPPARFLEAVSCLRRAVDMAEAAGKEVNVQPGLVERINARIERLEAKFEGKAPAELALNSDGMHATDQGVTRFCLDPWASLSIKASGAVETCCREHNLCSVQELARDDTGVNNGRFQALRRQLLEGDLNPVCLLCPDKRLATVEQLREALTAYLSLQ